MLLRGAQKPHLALNQVFLGCTSSSSHLVSESVKRPCRIDILLFQLFVLPSEFDQLLIFSCGYILNLSILIIKLALQFSDLRSLNINLSLSNRQISLVLFLNVMLSLS